MSKMSISRMFIRWFAILSTFAFVFTLPVLAKSEKKVTLTILNPVKLGSAQLNPGDYTVVVDGDKLTVEQGKKVVANVAGRWEDEKTKAQATEYESSSGSVTKLYFGGEARAFIPGE